MNAEKIKNWKKQKQLMQKLLLSYKDSIDWMENEGNKFRCLCLTYFHNYDSEKHISYERFYIFIKDFKPSFWDANIQTKLWMIKCFLLRKKELDIYIARPGDKKTREEILKKIISILEDKIKTHNLFFLAESLKNQRISKNISVEKCDKELKRLLNTPNIKWEDLENGLNASLSIWEIAFTIINGKIDFSIIQR
jgi:hypothetical protein